MSNQIWNLLYNDALLTKVLFIVLCCLCLFLLARSVYEAIRRRWSSLYFAALCVSVLIWAVCSLLVYFSWGDTALLHGLSIIGILPIPALLYFHVRQQVSYKNQRIIFIILPWVIPVFLIFLVCRDLFFPQFLGFLPSAEETPWYNAIFYLYTIVALVRSYLLCFDVLYQMPRRTRKSTHYMLVSITSFVLLLVLNNLWTDQMTHQLTDQLSVMITTSETMEILMSLATPLAFFFLLFPLYKALQEMPASEVIVTSREFVVGSLSTAILVLSRSMRILDWNKTDWEAGYPLPQPRYKEHIDSFRHRMLAQENCRISPHDENIIIFEQDEIEKHFYMTSHPAGNKKEVFGYILEISEVTPLYTLLRQFEDIAYRDHLTNLYNRNAYLESVEKFVRENNLPLLIFVGDVNGLKQLNDAHGHLLGDELLVAVADIIKKVMPRNAFAARIGGDEFVMLVPHGSAELADAFVKNVITLCVNTHHEVFGSPSISWGYAIMTSMSQSYNDVFSEADAIMYKYKKARHEFHSSGLVPDTLLTAGDKSEEDSLEPVKSADLSVS